MNPDLIKKKVLVLTNSEDIRSGLQKILNNLECEVNYVSTINDLAEIKDSFYDIVIIHFLAPEVQMMKMVKKWKEKFSPIIMLIYSYSIRNLKNMKEFLSRIDFAFFLPIESESFKNTFMQVLNESSEERRISFRKKGIAFLWISKYNSHLKKSGLFSSPYNINISNNGLSFESYVEYAVNDVLKSWTKYEETGSRLIELDGVIRWKKKVTSRKEDMPNFQYGLEFNLEKGDDVQTFLEIISRNKM